MRTAHSPKAVIRTSQMKGIIADAQEAEKFKHESSSKRDGIHWTVNALWGRVYFGKEVIYGEYTYQLGQCRQFLEKEAKNSPNDPELLLDLARVYILDKDWEASKKTAH